MENATLEELKAKEAEILEKVPLDVVELGKIRQAIMEKSTITETPAPEQPSQPAVKYDFTTDFNDVFGVTFLNDTFQSIIDGIKATLSGKFKADLDAKEQAHAQLESQLQDALTQLAKEREDKAQALTERDDFERKLQNATVQLGEKDAVIAQQKGWIEDLQKQVAEAPLAHNRIDITPSNFDTEALKRKRAEEEANKPKIYELEWADPILHNTYKAKDANGNDITFPWTELGKYNVQVGQFRPQATPDVVPETARTSVEPALEASFPEPPTLPTVPAQVADGESADGVDQQAVTRAEIEVINKRLDRLEKHAGLNVLDVA